MSEQLKSRTKTAAVKLVIDLKPINYQHESFEFKRQLIRCCTSVAANYRAACRAKSSADFINKLKTVEEECDETVFWLEFLREVGTEIENHGSHEKEFNELLAIVVASIKTARNR